MAITTDEISRKLTSKGSRAAYILHEDKLNENIAEIKRAFGAVLNDFTIAYSFKTNYMKYICRAMKESGIKAEVVSPYELEYAMKLGFEPQDIVYNGVIPDPEGKVLVASHGGIVNVDNTYECREIAEYAKTPIKLGLRVGIDVGNGISTRFGTDQNRIEEKVKEVSAIGNISLAGFHCHTSSSRQLEYWNTKAKAMAEIHKRYGGNYIDYGGGMFGLMEHSLSEQFEEPVLTFNEYAKCIACSLPETNTPTVILEPGTALVGNALDYATVVTDIKQAGDKAYIVVGGTALHCGPICETKRLPVKVAHTGPLSRHVENADMVGATCLEGDVLFKDYTGNIGVGDVIVFGNVGAYSIAWSRRFIIPRPPVLSGATGDIIEEQESMEYMFG